VTISLHQDVQGEAYDYPATFFEHRVWPVTRRPPAASELAAAAGVLRGAERPLVIAGGGVRYSAAEDELRAFAEAFGIPVAETSAGKGSLTGSERLVGGLGVNGSRAANELARDADAVICVGTRLTDFTTGSHSLFADPGVRFVGINVNGADAHKLSATPIVADAREALRALREELAGGRIERDASAQLAAWSADLEADLAPRDGQPPGQGEVLRELNAAARAGDWVVAAAGWQPGDLLKLWETPRGGFTHIEFGYSCMGHEIPAGLGIRMHEGEGPEVFVVIGDGSYLMNPTELVTAAQESLKLTVIVLDNGGYGSIHGLARGSTGTSVGNERRRRGERFPDGEVVPVDFVANARSMGCEAVLVETLPALREALATARDADATTVIVCPVAPDRPLLPSGAFWDLGVPEVAASAETRRLTADHRERARAQRHY
jgi:3D-(3,5/4)-trihydroxycyclohexane-1,2-dione acylhydrolase (decyclizing)